MSPIIDTFSLLLGLVRPAVLAITTVTALGAIASWATRTRRIGPFSSAGRFIRGKIDPAFAPAEKRLLIMGGKHENAPWWTLAAVAVGGLVLISSLDFLRGQLIFADYAMRNGVRGILQLLVVWTIAFLKLAIVVRIISSWFGGSPYRGWAKWAFTVSQPILGPLQKIIPTFGPIDVSPIVAYFGLTILRSLLLNAI